MVIWLQVNVFHGHMDGLLQREHRSRRCFCSGWIGERKSSTLSRRRFPLPKLIEGFEVAGPPLVVVLVYSHPLPPGRRRWNIEATSRTGYYWLQVQRFPWAYGLRERERERLQKTPNWTRPLLSPLLWSNPRARLGLGWTCMFLRIFKPLPLLLLLLLNCLLWWVYWNNDYIALQIFCTCVSRAISDGLLDEMW